MSNNLQVLKNYFETGTAEGDESFLKEVFVPSEEYLDIVSVPKSGLRILLGNKGSGKSAILRFFRKELVDLDIPVLLLRPKDIALTPTKDNALGPLTRGSENAIIKSIAHKMGEGISGLVINSDDKKLLESAKKEGFRGDDVVEKLFKIFGRVGKKLSDIDFLGVENLNIKGLEKSIASSLDRSESLFYVLIDDTDQIASPNESNHLNRIWAFLLAARSINESCGNIKFIISFRDEVWRRLKRDEAGQRDQVDHFRSVTKKIVMSDSNLKKIITRRLEKAHKDIGKPSYLSPYSLFFDENSVHIPSTAEEYRYWDDFIVKRSRERPRDSIQLIDKLCDFAISSKLEKILASHVEKIMPIYSEERVDDLKRECYLECPEIKEIIRAFHDVEYDAGAFSLLPQTMADFLNSLPSRFQIELFSKNLSHNNREDVFLLWRYLHEIGYFNARVSDSRERLGYRHVSADEDAEFISASRWNDMQATLWEIHPAYRDYLIKIKNEKEFDFGRPTKKKRKRH